MAIRAAVFDLDGTICDTLGDIAASMNRAFTHVGLPTHPTAYYAQCVGNGIRKNLWSAAPAGTPDDILEEALAFYLKDYPEHCADTTVPYPGFRQLLSELAGRGLKLAVVTNKTEATAQRLIRALLPEVDFALVWGRHDSRPLKPDPALGEALCDALSLIKEEILFCGDGDADVKFALNCGFFPVAVTWGYRTVAQLKEVGAEHFADTAEDILRYV